MKAFILAVALIVMGVAVWAQSTSISYTFQFSPPRDVSQPGGCAQVLTENGQPASSGDVMCLSFSRYNSAEGFSLYLYSNTLNELTLEGGTLAQLPTNRIWNYTAPPKAPCLSSPGPGSTFTDLYSNSFSNALQGWSGAFTVEGHLTSTQKGFGSRCTWEAVHTNGKGTETFTQ